MQEQHGAGRRSLSILHVDDDENDRLFFASAAKKFPVKLFGVRDAREGEAYLNGVGKYSDRTLYPKPDLIVLDLKMPGLNGFDFLQWRSGSPHASIPLVVLTSSMDRSELDQAKLDGALMTFTKPCEIAQLSGILLQICSVCIDAAPSRGGTPRQ